jgi:hypothetical protein
MKSLTLDISMFIIIISKSSNRMLQIKRAYQSFQEINSKTRFTQNRGKGSRSTNHRLKVSKKWIYIHICRKKPMNHNSKNLNQSKPLKISKKMKAPLEKGLKQSFSK